MSIILKRQDNSSVCCPALSRKKSRVSTMKEAEVLIGIVLTIIGTWIILVNL